MEGVVRPAMTLSYASLSTRLAPLRSRLLGWAIVLLVVLLPISVTLCVRAIRWDRWANYENNHRPWYDGIGGESYSSFKAWRAWRASWDRSLDAVLVSAGAVFVGGWILRLNWGADRLSRVLLMLVLLHAVVLVWFGVRWGPDFRHPAAHWGG